MSRPRVGWSSSSSRTSPATSQRASTTFCWLPPESRWIAVPRWGVRIESRSIHLSTIVACLRGETSGPEQRAFCLVSIMFSATDIGPTMPSTLRSAGT